MFTGLAVYSPNIFDGMAEDVSSTVGIISPFETPLLNALGDPDDSAKNVLHEWMEDSLNPNSIIVTGAIGTNPASGTAEAGIAITGGESQYLMPGTILLGPNSVEYLQVTAKSPTTIDVIRGYGGTTTATSLAGASFTVIAEAAQDGADVLTDVSRPRNRKFNYTQIFKKDIIVSGTNQAVKNLGGVGNEFDHQKVSRTREALRDLEKAVYLSILSGNTIGTAALSRSFKGLYASLTTNQLTIGAALTEPLLKSVIKSAWDNGATDVDLLTADAVWKDAIDGFNATRIRVTAEDPTVRNIVTSYESSYGIQKILPPSRWMLPSTVMALASRRIKVVPLTGRTFQFKGVSSTGDADKGMVLGEYTLEVRNEEGMARARIS